MEVKNQFISSLVIRSSYEKWVLFVLIIGAVLLRIAFALYTDRTWEDALITVLHAENFWQGLGLTHYKPGELPLHGFTSPISVLLPVLGGIGNGGDYSLGFLKIISSFAGGLCVWLMFKIYQKTDLGISLPVVIFSGTYLAFEHHQILWGMAGMETTVVVAILFYFFFACAIKSPNQIGVAMALALYARPDFVFLNLIGLAYIFHVRRDQVARVLIIAFLIYAPWLIFTTAYYGSPIPNTIYAKYYGYAFASASKIHKFLDFIVPLGPSFGGHGTGYWRDWDAGAISIVIFALFCAGCYQIVRKRVVELYVPAVFVVVYWIYYVFLVAGVFGWYVVPVSAATVFIAGYGLVCSVSNKRSAIIISVAYCFSILSVLPSNVQAERQIQLLIERPARQSLGIYLGEIMKPDEYVGMEPLGYSSYYSRKPILDYPGLASRKVVDFLKEHPRSGLCSMLEGFKPEYIVLRHYECNDSDFLKSHYLLIKDFKASPNINNIKGVEHNIDIHFRLFRRIGLDGNG